MKNRRSITLFVFLLMVTSWNVSSAATLLESFVPKKDIPNGWALIDGPHLYTKKNLFEHIDGQAELFFQYGFQKSVFAIYKDKGKDENQIELDIYDMGNALQAFGTFSRFRNEDRPGGFGLESYLDDHSALFYQGKYFIMVYAAEANPDFLKKFSKLVSLKISDPSPPPKEISYFPKNGLKPGSIQYFSEGLLGHQFLKRGFQGTYVEKTEDKAEAKDREFKLFIAIFKDSQEAVSALKAYKEDLAKKGNVFSGGSIVFKASAVRGEDPYQGKVFVLQRGVYLLGIVGFEKEQESENLLAEFVKNVK